MHRSVNEFMESIKFSARGVLIVKPSVWSCYFYDLSPEDSIDAFVEGGFFCSELSTEHAEQLLLRGNAEKEGCKLKAYANSCGFLFPQGHLKLKANISGEESEKTVDELKRWLDLFCALEIKSAVLHAGSNVMGLSRKALLEKRCRAVSELSNYIKGTEMYICLENLRTETIDFESLHEIILYSGCSNIGICLDTGHLNLCGANHGEFITKAGSYLKALHIADNEGESDQHLMPYGKGTVNWNEVMTALNKSPYDGLFNFEIPGESGCVPLEIRKEKLLYIKKMSDYMLSL
jgi:sugar phosphate isomerase/epimerase